MARGHERLVRPSLLNALSSNSVLHHFTAMEGPFLPEWFRAEQWADMLADWTAVAYLRQNTLIWQFLLVLQYQLWRGQVYSGVWVVGERRHGRALLLNGNLAAHLSHQLLRQAAVLHDVLRGGHLPEQWRRDEGAGSATKATTSHYIMPTGHITAQSPA